MFIDIGLLLGFKGVVVILFGVVELFVVGFE